jgi:serine/threonine-protein kinase
LGEAEPSDADRFLGEAESRGLLSAAQSADCRRIASTLAEVQADLPVDEITVRKGWLTAPQVAEIRRALARMRVGRYEVIGRIGEGAAGVVWKARDTKLDRVVALKVLSQRAAAVPAFRERFLREARIAVTLNDVNIVRGLDYGEADGYQFFAMEFVDGENAEQRLARMARIGEKDALSMALDVVRALQHAQKFKIVHRDIKPGNLLITQGGRVKLGDLGLAKPMIAEKELLAGDGSTAGTPFYMSPEQIRDPDSVDWRSDVYSLGATLYHLMTGSAPFRPDAKQSVLQKHVHERPKNPREIVLELSDGASAVVLKMMQKDPAERFNSLEDLAADLESVIAGRPPFHTNAVAPEVATAERHARQAVARKITEKTNPRDGFPWATVGTIAVVAGVLVAGWFVLRGDHPEKPPAPGNAGVTPSPPLTTPDPVPPRAKPDPRPAPPPSNVQPEADVETLAAAEYQERMHDAQLAANDQNYSEAMKILRAVPPRFAQTKAARDAEEAAKRVDQRAHEHFDEFVARAEKAAAEHRFDEARTIVEEQAAHVQVSWAEAAARTVRKKIDADQESYDRAHDTQAAAFADLYGEAILACGGADGVAAARAVVDAGAQKLDAYAPEIAELRADLDVVAKNGTDPDAIDDRTPEGALARLVAVLAKGNIQGADAAIEGVRKAGGSVDDAKARAARVRGVLVKRADAILAAAQTLLAANTAQSLDEASRRADEALKVLKEYAPASVMLGRIRVAQNRPDDAIACLKACVQRRDAPAEAHFRYGQALAAKGENLALAVSEIEQFLAMTQTGDPLRADAQTALSDVSARRVKDDVAYWKKTAKTAARGGLKKAAEGAWGRVLEFSPDDGEAIVALGQIYVAAGWTQSATLLLSRCANLAANDPNRKKAEDLLKPLGGATRVSDEDREYVKRCEKAFAGEDWDSAIKWSNAALTLSPYLSETRSRRVRALLACCRERTSARMNDDAKRANVDDAATALADAVILVTQFDDAPSLALRSAAYLATGNARKASEDADLAVKKSDGKNAAALIAQGRSYLGVGEPFFLKRAGEAFDASYKLEPSAEALLGRAETYERQEEISSAEAVLATLRERHGVPRWLKSEYDALMEQLANDH